MGPMDHHLWHVLLWEWSGDRQLHQNSFSPRIQRLVLPSIVPLQRQVGYLDLHDWNKSIQTPTINFLFIYRRDFGRCISFFSWSCKQLQRAEVHSPHFQVEAILPISSLLESPSHPLRILGWAQVQCTDLSRSQMSQMFVGDRYFCFEVVLA